MASPSSPQPSLVLSMPRTELARLCRIYGAGLQHDLALTDDGCGKPIDGPRLLWAMAGQESSFGSNMKPRFEPAYYMGGRYWNAQTPGGKEVRDGVALYGRDFACSYGPLQILAVNAKGHSPMELGSDPEKALAAACAMLRLVVLQRQKASTIGEICDCWNTGNDKDKNVPVEYIEHVERYYATAVMG
jgi:hypothetical protein